MGKAEDALRKLNKKYANKRRNKEGYMSEDDYVSYAKKAKAIGNKYNRKKR